MRNNKGFSMVELIIVIAVMAILAGAIAPTLIKYVSKSRMSADIKNANEIANCTQIALAESEIADYVFSQTMPYSVYTDALDSTDIFEAFILEHMSASIPCKYRKNGAEKFQITIYPNDAGTGFAVEVTATANGMTAKTAGIKGTGYLLFPNVDPSYE